MFHFEDLHPDGPELIDDLDWLLRFVAAGFEVRVHGEPVYSELEFPVLELASVLSSWVSTGLPEHRDLEYEVTGGEGITIALRWRAGGWVVDSDWRVAGSPEGPSLDDVETQDAVERFIAALEHEIGRGCGFDVRALLERLHAGSERSASVRWRPPWRSIDRADVTFGIRTDRADADLRLSGEERAVRSWLVDWLRAYAERLELCGLADEATFFYLLATHPLGDPDGRVRHHGGVMEVGFGSEPAGPTGAPMLPVGELLERAATFIRAA